MYVLYMFFNRNFDECLHVHLFKSSDRLLSVVALTDIIIKYFSHKQSWHLLSKAWRRPSDAIEPN